MRRRATVVALEIGLSVAVLGATLAALGARQIWERMRAPHGGYLLLALAVASCQFPLLAARWCFMARKLGVPLSYRRALGEYYLATLLNQILPFGVLGDATRGVRHARRAPAGAGRSAVQVALAIALERGSGQLALWLFVLAVLPSWSHDVRAALVSYPSAVPLTAAAALAVSVSIWLFVRKRSWASRAHDLVKSGGRVVFLPRNLAVHLALSVALVLLHVATFSCAARGLGLSVPLVPALRIVPLMLVASTLPAFFSGWGIREAATAGLYQLAGSSASDGAAIALAFGAIGLLASTPGIATLLFAKRGEPASVSSTTRPHAAASPGHQ